MRIDHTKHFRGLQQDVAPVEVRVPNSVSRHAKTAERAFVGVISESGKPVLDAELNLHSDTWFEQQSILRGPSGWLKGRGNHDGYVDYRFDSDGISDDSGSIGDPGISPLSHEDGTFLNSFALPKLTALVAGRPVVVEYTNTDTPGFNVVGLSEPTVYDGTNTTIKRTDFVFLEVWQALVAPSPSAMGFIQVSNNDTLVAGDVVNINGIALTAVEGVAGEDEFQIGATANQTAANIRDTINDEENSFVGIVNADSSLDTVTLRSQVAGVGSEPLKTGNYTTLAVDVDTLGSVVVSGPTLTGGEDRPNKPSQNEIYRHGNTLSPESTWLLDELVDPFIQAESSQRIQLQYRLRATSASEQISYKKHPDGFSSPMAGGEENSAAVLAQGGRSEPVDDYPFVRADGASTWLETSAAAYGAVDSGLWVAGDGSEEAAQALGAVDGFVYAIPVCFVHRHNNVSDDLAGSKGFDPINNTNGAPLYAHEGYDGVLGVIPEGESDRPDGHFADVISHDNILDLRRHITTGDLYGELQYQIQSLLDGTLHTWSVDIADKQTLGGDSGDVSTRYLVCNEIGRSQLVGGDAPHSGDTDRGVLIRNFDHIARRFGDQSVVERVVIPFYPGDREGVSDAPGTTNPGKYVIKADDPTRWYEGDTLVLDLDELDASTLGSLWDGATGGGGSADGLASANFTDFAPPGTVITDVLGAWHDDGNYAVAIPQQVEFASIVGVGTHKIEAKLDSNVRLANGGVDGAANYVLVGKVGSNGSPRRIFLEVEITYPAGFGLTDTPDYVLSPSTAVYSGESGQGPGPLIEASVGQRPADLEALCTPRFRQKHREVRLEYVANDTQTHDGDGGGSPLGSVTSQTLVSRSQSSLVFPRRVYATAEGPLSGQTVVAVGETTYDVDEGTSEFGSSSRLIKLEENLPGVGQTQCTIQYYSQDPLPNYGESGYQVGVYYRSNAPQTAGTKEGDVGSSGDGTLPTTLKVEPLVANPTVWTGQTSSGSNYASYPYSAPLDQIPINASNIGEWFFSASAMVTLSDFNADTGLLALHPFVQVDVQGPLILGGEDNSQKPKKDSEFRAFYPVCSYRPTVLAQPLKGATRHKVLVPMLARVVDDTPGVAGGVLFRRSEVVLVVLTRFAELDEENTIRFTETDNTASAAVYRTRNLLLMGGTHAR